MPANPLKVRRVFDLAPEVVRMQTSIVDAIDYLAKIPILQGVAVTDVMLTSGSVNQVVHGLGRDVQGWIVTSINADTRIYDELDSPSTYDLSTILPLTTVNNCTVDLWVW